MTQQELAEKLKALPYTEMGEAKNKGKRTNPVDARTIRRWEQGLTPIHHYQRELAKALGRDVRELGYPENGIPFWHVLYPRNPFFTGREEILAQLYDVVERRDTQYSGRKYWSDLQDERITLQPQALVGLSGAGKTQIALEYAYCHQREYQTIFWLRAHSREVLELDFAALADTLNLPEKKDSSDRTGRIEAVKEWLTHFTRWLLIFDGADELGIIRAFLPQKCFGHVIITTQSAATADLAQAINVDEMQPEEGTLFLLRRSKEVESETDTAYLVTEGNLVWARRIVELLGRWPLMLDQAGAYIEIGQCGLEKYAEEYQAEPVKHLRYTDELGMYYHPHPVAETFAKNFKKVREANPVAADLLYLLAFLDPSAIPEEILTNAFKPGPGFRRLVDTPGALTSAMIELRKYSLVQRTAETNTCTLHPLVQVVLRDELEEEEQQQWANRAVLAVYLTFISAFFQGFAPDSAYPIRKTLWHIQRYLPQVFACRGIIKQWHGGFYTEEFAQCLLDTMEFWNILIRYAYLQLFLPNPEEAIDVDEARSVLGPLALPMTQGISYLREGAVKETANAFQQAVESIDEKMDELIEDDPLETLYSDLKRMIQLAGQLMSQPFVNEAFEKTAGLFFQEATTIMQKLIDDLKSEYISDANDLINHFLQQGDSKRAEWLLAEAIAFGEESLDSNHPALAQWYYDLASLYIDRRVYYVKAEEFLQHALSIVLQHTPTLQRVVEILSLFGFSYVLQEKYTQAEQEYHSILDLEQESLGQEHPAVAESLDRLATIHLLRGQYTDAIELSEQALAIVQKAYGEQHVETVEYLCELGDCYITALDELDEDFVHAVEYREEAKKLFTKAYEILTALGELEHSLAERIRDSLIWLGGTDQQP